MEEYISLEEVKKEVRKALKNKASIEKFENGECVGILYLNDKGFFCIIFKKSDDKDKGTIFIDAIEVGVKGKVSERRVVCKDMYLEV